MSSEQDTSSTPISVRTVDATAEAPTVEEDFTPPFARGEVLLGKYRIDELIGVGGVGFVMSATNIGLDEQVALKFLRPEYWSNEEAASRFSAEAKLACKIQSLHVARVLDIESLPGAGPFIVMERLLGRDLNQILNDEGPLPVEQAVDYVLQACEALSAAHACDIVHRDVKPDNLFLARQRQGPALIKILDFGISKLQLARATGGRNPSLFQPAAALGSPSYMSPEQVRGALDIDARADVWSLGCVLYELLTGQHAFDGPTLMQICAAVLEQQPASLRATRPDVCRALEAVVMRCLEKAPEHRYRDVAALARDLEPFGSASAGTPAGWQPMMPDEVTLQLATPARFSSFGDAPLAEEPPPELESELVVYSPASVAPMAIDAAPPGFRSNAIISLRSERASGVRPRVALVGLGVAACVAGFVVANSTARHHVTGRIAQIAAEFSTESTPSESWKPSAHRHQDESTSRRLGQSAPEAAPRSTPKVNEQRLETASASIAEASALSVASLPMPKRALQTTTTRAAPVSSVAESSAVTPAARRSGSSASSVTKEEPSLAMVEPTAELERESPVSTPPMARPDPSAASRARLASPRRAQPRPAASAISAVVRAHSAQIQNCFERAGVQYEQFKGKITIETVVDPAGHVVRASVPGALDGGLALTRCLSSAASNWKFPVGAGATSFSSYRLLLD